jgi:hypothetical protein
MSNDHSNNHDDNSTSNEQTQPAQAPTTAGEMSLALIEEQADRTIRRVLHDGRMFFSVIDVIAVLTDSSYPGRYWTDMKRNIHSKGFRELLSKCRQLKLTAPDGKLRETDCADFATAVSLVHSLPALRSRTNRDYLDQNVSPSDCGIYAIINTSTHEQYIGSSGDIPKRFAQHKALLRRGKHHAPRLQAAWDSYGEAAFEFVVLEELPTSDLLEAVEQRYLDAEQPAYNGATVANNMSAQVILQLYDIQQSTTQTPLFQALRTAIMYGIVKPGPNFPYLVQAEANGIDTWEALSVFIQQQQRLPVEVTDNVH